MSAISNAETYVDAARRQSPAVARAYPSAESITVLPPDTSTAFSSSRTTSTVRTQLFCVWLTAMWIWPSIAAAQTMTGTLVGTVRDEQGGAIAGALVHLNSTALIGGPVTMATDERGQFRFPVLPLGTYVVEVERDGFATYHEEDVSIGASITLERTVVLKIRRRAESIVVEGAGSRIEARSSGFETPFRG